MQVRSRLLAECLRWLLQRVHSRCKQRPLFCRRAVHRLQQPVPSVVELHLCFRPSVSLKSRLPAGRTREAVSDPMDLLLESRPDLQCLSFRSSARSTARSLRTVLRPHFSRKLSSPSEYYHCANHSQCGPLPLTRASSPPMASHRPQALNVSPRCASSQALRIQTIGIGGSLLFLAIQAPLQSCQIRAASASSFHSEHEEHLDILGLQMDWSLRAILSPTSWVGLARLEDDANYFSDRLVHLLRGLQQYRAEALLRLVIVCATRGSLSRKRWLQKVRCAQE
mmetsp:Transcript_46372/g.72325  ORF Transcript_46372/g.72325 Transcript_46372/m.72325 type:complete len:281 (+) Transcript_46372:798-1640(+)